MKNTISLLFVDDETKFLENTTRRLRLRGVDVFPFSDGAAALKAAQEGAHFDVALLDLKMPGMDGEALLGHLKEHDPKMEVVILTGHGSIKSAATLTRSGAYEYLLKPCDLDEVITAISNAYAKRIKAVNESNAKIVDAILDNATGYSPLDILNKLKAIRQK